MKIKFRNLKLAHEKDLNVVADVCKENGVDLNEVRIKHEANSSLPKNTKGVSVDIEQMKLDLKHDKEYE
jgi:hypothetical protein